MDEDGYRKIIQKLDGIDARLALLEKKVNGEPRQRQTVPVSTAIEYLLSIMLSPAWLPHREIAEARGFSHETWEKIEAARLSISEGPQNMETFRMGKAILLEHPEWTVACVLNDPSTINPKALVMFLDTLSREIGDVKEEEG